MILSNILGLRVKSWSVVRKKSSHSFTKKIRLGMYKLANFLSRAKQRNWLDKLGKYCLQVHICICCALDVFSPSSPYSDNQISDWYVKPCSLPSHRSRKLCGISMP